MGTLSDTNADASTSFMASRRNLFALAGASLLAPAGLAMAEEGKTTSGSEPFGYCLNTSTISGQKLKFTQVIEIAAKAGFRAIEPWIREIEAYVKDGGSLATLRKQIADLGLTIESAIGFAEWAVDDDARRARGLEVARKDLDLVAQLGGKRLAAPPAGATDVSTISPAKLAERYKALLSLGDQAGVVPQVEVWGFSKCLSRLGEALHVAAESGHEKACVLADVYHLHRGGSGFGGLHLTGPNTMHVLHINDYPDGPAAGLNDSMRVYPGDGVAPLTTIFRTLKAAGYRGYLSLELFNRDYWKNDPLEVATTGFRKTREAVLKAFS